MQFKYYKSIVGEGDIGKHDYAHVILERSIIMIGLFRSNEENLSCPGCINSWVHILVQNLQICTQALHFHFDALAQTFCFVSTLHVL